MTALSVIIPVHDGERYLAEAIASVLAQTSPPYEVIVVDDGSTDGSAAVARRFTPNVRCVRQARGGVAAACNRGLAEAGGELIAYLDADDLWTSGKLAAQTQRLAAEPELDVVFGRAREFVTPDLDGPGPAVRPGPVPFRARSSMLVRRPALERVGAFDTSWRVGEFVDWYARATEAGLRSVMLDEVVLLRRLHAHNLGRQDPSARVDFTRIARAALHRRRTRA